MPKIESIALIFSKMNEAFEDLGVRAINEKKILSILIQKPGQTKRQISDITGKESGNVWSSLNNLLAKGMIRSILRPNPKIKNSPSKRYYINKDFKELIEKKLKI